MLLNPYAGKAAQNAYNMLNDQDRVDNLPPTTPINYGSTRSQIAAITPSLF